jgi:DNA-directed RNA polymerase specialized sigma24 family protein
VYDVDAPSSKLVLAQLSEPTVCARLLKIACWSTKSEADAEDLVADSLIRVLDPDDEPWMPTKCTFLTHMTFVIRRVWYRERRRRMVQREVVDNRIARDENTMSLDPSPDDEFERRRTTSIQRVLGERVLASIGDDPIARRVFELGAEGLHEPLELAEHVPCTPEEVKFAVLRLKRHGAFVLHEWNEEERSRMATVREDHANRLRQATESKTEGTP